MEMYCSSVPDLSGIPRSTHYGILGYYHMSYRGAVEMHCLDLLALSGMAVLYRLERPRYCHAKSSMP
jgi:hypothetical protein